MPIEQDAGYWRQKYEEQLALQEDGFTALLAERDRYRGTLRAIAQYVDEERMPQVDWILDRVQEAFESVCEHRWVDIRNAVVESGEMCSRCHAIRAGNATAPSDEQTTSTAAGSGEKRGPLEGPTGA